MVYGKFEEDDDVQAALTWFAEVSGNQPAFVERLARAQQAYRTITADKLGRDPTLSDISPDVVGAFLAQAKSLLDDRRSYDLALASQIIPWLKQIGVNIAHVPHIPGATERAVKMLREESVAPESAMFELVMASNYAADGLDVAFIPEGAAKTPDFRILLPEMAEAVYVECKRLKRGQYEIQEQALHRELFMVAAQLIDERNLSIDVDVTYTQELEGVPVSYLADRIKHVLSSPIIVPAGYPWRDEFGFGIVRPANLAAVHQDSSNGCLYFGTKLGRLLSGRSIRQGGYHLSAGADPDKRDPRFIDKIQFGSVVTWQCIAPAAIQKKARYVKARLVEADRQLKDRGFGIAHLAMDMEIACDSSDLRRARNIEAITAFRSESDLVAVYLHYIVPRITETNSWMVDETVDRFGSDQESVPTQMIFPSSSTLDNDLPSWRQKV